VRVVDRLEKRYEEPGLNLTHDVREGVLKHTSWKADYPFPLDFPEGLAWESGGSLEAQVVNWSDEIAQQTHDLEDGLPLTEEPAIEELAISRLVRAARGYGNDPASRRASLIRGMIATLTADLVEGSRARIERWLETSRIAKADDFYARRERLPGDLVAFSEGGKRLYAELREFVYRHIIHSFRCRAGLAPRAGRRLRGVPGQSGLLLDDGANERIFRALPAQCRCARQVRSRTTTGRGGSIARSRTQA
jgi:dGTPase